MFCPIMSNVTAGDVQCSNNCGCYPCTLMGRRENVRIEIPCSYLRNVCGAPPEFKCSFESCPANKEPK